MVQEADLPAQRTAGGTQMGTWRGHTAVHATATASKPRDVIDSTATRNQTGGGEACARMRHRSQNQPDGKTTTHQGMWTTNMKVGGWEGGHRTRISPEEPCPQPRTRCRSFAQHTVRVLEGQCWVSRAEHAAAASQCSLVAHPRTCKITRQVFYSPTCTTNHHQRHGHRHKLDSARCSQGKGGGVVRTAAPTTVGCASSPGSTEFPGDQSGT